MKSLIGVFLLTAYLLVCGVLFAADEKKASPLTETFIAFRVGEKKGDGFYRVLIDDNENPGKVDLKYSPININELHETLKLMKLDYLIIFNNLVKNPVGERAHQALDELSELKAQLNSLSESEKKYYENNKDAVKEKASQRLKKIAEENPEKIKEYRRNAYLKRKEKLNVNLG